MEKDALTSGFRARAAQLLTWLMGPVQQQRQQQTMQTERQLYDGVPRGMDDPDNRRQVAADRGWQQGYDAHSDTQEMRLTAHNFAVEAAQQRDALHDPVSERAHAREMESGYRPLRPQLSLTQERIDHLATQIEALQQRLQAQRQDQQQTRQRGQGMGW